MTGYKPFGPHNWLFDGAPAMCWCADCHEKVRALRCPVVFRDPNDRRRKVQCGDYRGHREPTHTMLIASAFLP